MISRYILILLGVISLIWIGYVGINLVDSNEEFNPNCFFGVNDEKILVINRLDEVPVDENKFSISPKAFNLFINISKFLKKGSTIYLSKNQDQLLICKKDNWESDEVVHIFEKSNYHIEETGNATFKIDDFKVDFRHEALHIYSENVQFPKVKNLEWLKFDHKASASLIEFKSNGKSVLIKDIYSNSNGAVEYISKGNRKSKGKQIDDQDLFSSALPKAIESYHFYETTAHTILCNKLIV